MYEEVQKDVRAYIRPKLRQEETERSFSRETGVFNIVWWTVVLRRDGKRSTNESDVINPPGNSKHCVVLNSIFICVECLHMLAPVVAPHYRFSGRVS